MTGQQQLTPSSTTGPRAESLLGRLAQRVESDERLDPMAGRMAGVAQRLLGGRSGDWLRARPAGHAVHPPLTDLPIGTWTSATLLDLVGGPGARDASRRLVGVGILAAMPTAATGLAEYARLGRRDRRTGAVHASANSVALALNIASWLARRRGAHGAGRLLSGAALTAGGVGAFLGSHLEVARKVSSRDPAFEGPVA